MARATGQIRRERPAIAVCFHCSGKKRGCKHGKCDDDAYLQHREQTQFLSSDEERKPCRRAGEQRGDEQEPETTADAPSRHLVGKPAQKRSRCHNYDNTGNWNMGRGCGTRYPAAECTFSKPKAKSRASQTATTRAGTSTILLNS